MILTDNQQDHVDRIVELLFWKNSYGIWGSLKILINSFTQLMTYSVIPDSFGCFSHSRFFFPSLFCRSFFLLLIGLSLVFPTNVTFPLSLLWPLPAATSGMWRLPRSRSLWTSPPESRSSPGCPPAAAAAGTPSAPGPSGWSLRGHIWSVSRQNKSQEGWTRERGVCGRRSPLREKKNLRQNFVFPGSVGLVSRLM